MDRICAFVVVVAAGCSAKPVEPVATPAVPIDAPIDGITTIPTYDPSSGMHLDDDGPRAPTRPRADPVKRPGRPIEVTLRSTPSGASVMVDGQPLGPTPNFWQGEANGHEHEFMFTMPHHASARYRFVPVTSGVVHARLELVASDDPSAQAKTAVPPPRVPPAPSVSPPVPITPPPPPATIVSPDAAPPDATPPGSPDAPVVTPAGPVN